MVRIAGICGHFGSTKQFIDGQTIKTKMLTEELKIALSAESIKTVDTYGWKRNPIALFLKCLRLSQKCKNIVVLPAHNGVNVFIPLFLVLNQLFHRKLHYVVIGGWLPDLLTKNHKLKNQVSSFDGVYVETKTMVESLQKLGLNNVKYLPNFKRLNILEEISLIYPTGEPYKLCIFSRIMKEKGVEDAVEAIINVNEAAGKQIYSLDIYGQVDEKYCERFEELKKAFPPYIAYKGIVNYRDSVGVLKGYFSLLFPTRFKSEGIPGTIIDAYAAGIPVVVSSWNSCLDMVENGKTGLIFKIGDIDDLQRKLEYMYNNPQKIVGMKKNCLEKAVQFMPKKIINELITFFGDD